MPALSSWHLALSTRQLAIMSGAATNSWYKVHCQKFGKISGGVIQVLPEYVSNVNPDLQFMVLAATLILFICVLRHVQIAYSNAFPLAVLSSYLLAQIYIQTHTHTNLETNMLCVKVSTCRTHTHTYSLMHLAVTLHFPNVHSFTHSLTSTLLPKKLLPPFLSARACDGLLIVKF